MLTEAEHCRVKDKLKAKGGKMLTECQKKQTKIKVAKMSRKQKQQLKQRVENESDLNLIHEGKTFLKVVKT